MNDLYYDDSDEAEPEIEVDREQYIRKILADIKSHRFISRDDSSVKSEDDTEIISLNKRERKNIVSYFKILYHLADKDNGDFRDDLRIWGSACLSEFDVAGKLSWYERAMFNAVPDIIRSFSKSELDKCFDAACDYLIEIQNREIAEKFDKCSNNESELRKMRAEIKFCISRFASVLEKTKQGKSGRTPQYK